MSLIHVTDTTSLDSFRVAIEREVDRMVMRVGELLWAAKVAHPSEFDDWVEADLPFGRDTARRLMAIYRAYRELPEETVARLPRPWQAMFALRNVPQAELKRAMDADEIRPDMTVRQAVDWVRGRPYARGPGRPSRVADSLATRLMEHDPSELDIYIRGLLERWLRSPESDAIDLATPPAPWTHPG